MYKKELCMKKFLILLLAAMLLAGQAVVAEESVLIDFTTLDADILPDGDGTPQENRRTVMDYSIAAGATFTAEQKTLMRTSLTLPRWEVVLNASAKNSESTAKSRVVSAPVRESAEVPFAGKNVMGVRIFFPESPVNANAKIVPPFEIPAYEPYAPRDDNGIPQTDSDEARAAKAASWYQFQSDYGAEDALSPGYGIVRNVGTLKAIKVSVFGNSFPHGLYVILKDTDDVERRYFMGYLNFDGWKELQWNNPYYLSDVRVRELRVYPVYPRGLPYVKFIGFQITRDSRDVGGDFISYFKDISIIYDKAVLNTERDIAEEDLWQIVTDRERTKQQMEIQRFGFKQVDRFIEKEKMDSTEKFTSSIAAPAQEQ
jgi:hypothetical protein